MHEGIEFVIPGPPATKGSTWSFQHQGRIVTKHDCNHLAAWSRAIGFAAKSAGLRLTPRDGGVSVSAFFEFERPKRSRYSSPTVRPDIDKLARALLDALTGIAYEDDSQVLGLHLRKTFGPTTLTRVFILPAS